MPPGLPEAPPARFKTPLLATTTMGDRAIKRVQCASNCGSSFLTDRSRGAAYRLRRESREVMFMGQV